MWASIIIAIFLLMPMSLSAGEQADGEDIFGFPDGWSDELNLSDHPTKYDSQPKIAIDDNIVHVVWKRGGPGGGDGIMYTKSMDNGRTDFLIFSSRNPHSLESLQRCQD